MIQLRSLGARTPFPQDNRQNTLAWSAQHFSLGDGLALNHPRLRAKQVPTQRKGRLQMPLLPGARSRSGVLASSAAGLGATGSTQGPGDSTCPQQLQESRIPQHSPSLQLQAITTSGKAPAHLDSTPVLSTHRSGPGGAELGQQAEKRACQCSDQDEK